MLQSEYFLQVKPCSSTRCVHHASLNRIRTVRFSSLTSIFPSRASHPTAIETVDLGALTPFSTALRLDSPLERRKFHTRPAVSPIVLISTIKTSLAIVWHFNAGFQILARKIFPFEATLIFSNARRAKLYFTPDRRSLPYSNFITPDTGRSFFWTNCSKPGRPPCSRIVR